MRKLKARVTSDDSETHLQLQPVFEPRKHSNSFLRDRDDVFGSHAADSRIVQSRFHCQHLASFENGFLKARMLVNFQPEPVTSAMKKSGLPPVAQLGWITAIGKELLHFLVQLQAVDTGLHFFQCQRLPLIDRFPEPALFVAGAAAQHCSREIAIVPAGR